MKRFQETWEWLAIWPHFRDLNWSTLTVVCYVPALVVISNAFHLGIKDNWLQQLLTSFLLHLISPGQQTWSSYGYCLIWYILLYELSMMCCNMTLRWHSNEQFVMHWCPFQNRLLNGDSYCIIHWDKQNCRQKNHAYIILFPLFDIS